MLILELQASAALSKSEDVSQGKKGILPCVSYDFALGRTTKLNSRSLWSFGTVHFVTIDGVSLKIGTYES